MDIFTSPLLLFSWPVVFDSSWPHGLQHARFPYLTISQSLPKFMSIALVMPFNHLILWCPILLLPSIFHSIRDFSNESAVHIRWPKYWSLSFNISPFNEYLLKLTGLISLLSQGLSGVFSITTVWSHQFFGALSLCIKDKSMILANGYTQRSMNI